MLVAGTSSPWPVGDIFHAAPKQHGFLSSRFPIRMGASRAKVEEFTPYTCNNGLVDPGSIRGENVPQKGGWEDVGEVCVLRGARSRPKRQEYV